VFACLCIRGRGCGWLDGSPGWVFAKLGIDGRALAEADAALVMQHHYDFKDPRKVQEERYPTMGWSQNYRYAGNAIPWTLFFAGRILTPQFLIDGVNVQDYLQARRSLVPLEEDAPVSAPTCEKAYTGCSQPVHQRAHAPYRNRGDPTPSERERGGAIEKACRVWRYRADCGWGRDAAPLPGCDGGGGGASQGHAARARV
jgi:hypothetical protein